jgi:hypothetical protein
MKSARNVPHISDIFQLKLDYLEIFSRKITIQNYKEISPMTAALIQTYRQTDKYEGNRCPCDYAEGHKIHM